MFEVQRYLGSQSRQNSINMDILQGNDRIPRIQDMRNFLVKMAFSQALAIFIWFSRQWNQWEIISFPLWAESAKCLSCGAMQFTRSFIKSSCCFCCIMSCISTCCMLCPTTAICELKWAICASAHAPRCALDVILCSLPDTLIMSLSAVLFARWSIKLTASVFDVFRSLVFLFKYPNFPHLFFLTITIFSSGPHNPISWWSWWTVKVITQFTQPPWLESPEIDLSQHQNRR